MKSVLDLEVDGRNDNGTAIKASIRRQIDRAMVDGPTTTKVLVDLQGVHSDAGNYLQSLYGHERKIKVKRISVVIEYDFLNGQ